MIIYKNIKSYKKSIKTVFVIAKFREFIMERKKTVFVITNFKRKDLQKAIHEKGHHAKKDTAP